MKHKEARLIYAGKPVRGELLDITTAAKRSGMSNKWLYLHIEEEDLPFDFLHPPGGKIMFDSADIDDWLAWGRIRTKRLELDSTRIDDWIYRMDAQIKGMKNFIEEIRNGKLPEKA
jgi:predicted DNA-binding transcriptional regulator AlpA